MVLEISNGSEKATGFEKGGCSLAKMPCLFEMRLA
jgi:hypothetical protein